MCSVDQFLSGCTVEQNCSIAVPEENCFFCRMVGVIWLKVCKRWIKVRIIYYFRIYMGYCTEGYTRQCIGLLD